MREPENSGSDRPWPWIRGLLFGAAIGGLPPIVALLVVLL